LDPQTNPTHNPQPNRTPYNQQQTFGHKENNFNISQSVKVYQVLLIYQHLSLSRYQVLLQQSQETYHVLEFLELFLTHDPTQPTKKLKISTQLNPAQLVGRPDPWTTLIPIFILCAEVNWSEIIALRQYQFQKNVYRLGVVHTLVVLNVN